MEIFDQLSLKMPFAIFKLPTATVNFKNLGFKRKLNITKRTIQIM
jgi:hypothetical protein